MISHRRTSSVVGAGGAANPIKNGVGRSGAAEFCINGAKNMSGLFTATELSFALDLSRHDFFLHQPRFHILSKRRYGEVPVYAVALLPKNLRLRITEQRIERGCSSIEELVRQAQQSRRRIAVLDLVLYSRLAPSHDAFAVRNVIDGYFRSLDSGATEAEANTSARGKWLRRFGKRCNERTIRRIAARVQACGGPELAPIDAYADAKSVPHTRGGRRPHHGEAATAVSRSTSPQISFSRRFAA